MQCAASNGNADIVELLVKEGADMNATDEVEQVDINIDVNIECLR